jgi:hypothetical protein
MRPSGGGAAGCRRVPALRTRISAENAAIPWIVAPGIVSSRVKIVAVATMSGPSKTARLRSGSNRWARSASSSGSTSEWKALSPARAKAGSSSAVTGRSSMP